MIETQQIGRAVYVVGDHPFAGAHGVIAEYDEAHECFRLELDEPVKDHVECFACSGCLRVDRRHEH